MKKAGPLRVRYGVGENKTMTDGIVELIKKDFIVQDFAGDSLKQDQFVFLYHVHEILYNSCLRDEYLKGIQGGVIFKDVIPMLTVFSTMRRIRDINDRKLADINKEKEKQERRTALGIPEPEPEEEKLDIPLTDA